MLSSGSDTVNIKNNHTAVILGTSFGLSVLYDSAGTVYVNAPPSYSNHVCGLCGNFNHVKEDDFRKPDGAHAKDATALAESWQSGQTTSCETIQGLQQCSTQEEAEYGSELYCGGLLSSTGPFGNCLAILGAESYFRGCVVNMCSSHGDPSVLCETLQLYADICQKAGTAIPTWRNSTSCRMLLPLPPSEISRHEELASNLEYGSNCQTLSSFLLYQPFSVVQTATITHVLMDVLKCALAWMQLVPVAAARKDASVTLVSNSAGENVYQPRTVGAGILENTTR